MKPTHHGQIPWIQVCKDVPYFETENQQSWTPIGQNDAITWPDFHGLFRRNDPGLVEQHMAFLASHGITCIRMMMEYCQTEHRYLENPVGRFMPNMVRFWDDLFLLCEKYNIRLLITPFDTYWMAKRWKFHPYYRLSGGPSKSKATWLVSPEMISATKDRFTFFIERWGGSGVLFGWDLWNEIDPKHSGKDIEHLNRYIEQVSSHIRQQEMRLYMKTHLQTVSVFAPLLERHDITELIFRHPLLDFASTHMYQKPFLDNPRNVKIAAVTTGEMVKNSVLAISDGRPFLDSEHGPITYFRKNKKGLPQLFDDSYFLHMQWAHLASGAAGGGMRWPYRHPHTLTSGMRKAQLNMSLFTKLINWRHFERKNISAHILTTDPEVTVFGCGDPHQAVIWLMRNNTIKGRKREVVKRDLTQVSVPGLLGGNYTVHLWNTESGQSEHLHITKQQAYLEFRCILKDNLAIAIRKD